MKVTTDATAEIKNDVHNTQLKHALDQGTKVSKQWMERIDRCLQEVGEVAEQQNHVLEALHQVSRKIRQQTSDEVARDLGVIASGQIALHYWIAAFGTLRTYAASAGLVQTERELQACLEEAKRADEEHNHLASEILKSQAKMAA